MIAICKTNDAFEDQLTTDGQYPILEVRGGSVLIETDCGHRRWFASGRFLLRAK